MADLSKALNKLWEVEFSGNTSLMLHTVDGDTGGMTYKGIARNYHSQWEGWKIIDVQLQSTPNSKEASKVLSSHKGLQYMVEVFYRVEFWNKIQGDFITFQPTATELFLSVVNIGVHNAVKIAQEVSGAKVDGLFGMNTLQAINKTPVALFCEKYTELEERYYRNIVKRNPKQLKFLAGWVARAHAVDADNYNKVL